MHRMGCSILEHMLDMRWPEVEKPSGSAHQNAKNRKNQDLVCNKIP